MPTAPANSPTAAPPAQPGQIFRNDRWWVGAIEAGRRLHISRASVHRLADEGLLVDTFPLPHRRYFSVDSIERLLTARRADREFWQREHDPALGESVRADRRAARLATSAQARRAAD